MLYTFEFYCFLYHCLVFHINHALHYIKINQTSLFKNNISILLEWKWTQKNKIVRGTSRGTDPAAL